MNVAQLGITGRWYCANQQERVALTSMLIRAGQWNEDQLVEAARQYLFFYRDGNVPYKDGGTGLVHHVCFMKVGEDWVFVEVRA